MFTRILGQRRPLVCWFYCGSYYSLCASFVIVEIFNQVNLKEISCSMVFYLIQLLDFLVVSLTAKLCTFSWLYVNDREIGTLTFNRNFVLFYVTFWHSWLNGWSDVEEHFCGGEEQIWDSRWNIEEGKDHHSSRGSSCCCSLCEGHENSQREVSFSFTLLFLF